MSDKFYNKEFASIKSSLIDANHIESQEIKIYPGEGNLDKKKSIVEMFDDIRGEILSNSSHISYNDYKTIPFSEGIEFTPENGKIMDDIWYSSYFTMDNAILPNGIIKSLSLYFEDAKEQKYYLNVEVLDKEGNVIEGKTTRSINRCSIPRIREAVTWNFEGFHSPDDDHILRFSLSKSKNIELDNFIRIFIDRFALFPISNNPNAPYTSDFCKMCGKTSKYVNDSTVAPSLYNAVPLIRFTGDFFSPRNDVRTHVDNEDIHINSFEKTVIESLYSKSYTKVLDNIVDTGISDISPNPTMNISDIQACYLKRPYFTNGTFTKIEFPVGVTGTSPSSNSSANGVYLYVYLRDKNDKIVKTYTSENAVVFRGRNNGDSFLFKGIEINDDIYAIHFEASTNKNVNNNTQSTLFNSTENTFNGSLFRISETKNYGAVKRTGSEDPTGVIHVIFYKSDATLTYNGKDTSNNFSFKTYGSYDNAGNLTGVSISSGNVFLPYNQIVQIPGKENISITPSDETQYLVLDVFRSAGGDITYKYSVKSKDEMGYTIKTATELT